MEQQQIQALLGRLQGIDLAKIDDPQVVEAVQIGIGLLSGDPNEGDATYVQTILGVVETNFKTAIAPEKPAKAESKKEKATKKGNENAQEKGQEQPDEKQQEKPDEKPRPAQKPKVSEEKPKPGKRKLTPAECEAFDEVRLKLQQILEAVTHPTQTNTSTTSNSAKGSAASRRSRPAGKSAPRAVSVVIADKVRTTFNGLRQALRRNKGALKKLDTEVLNQAQQHLTEGIRLTSEATRGIPGNKTKAFNQALMAMQQSFDNIRQLKQQAEPNKPADPAKPATQNKAA